MLEQATVTANIPAADLARARTFYAEKLGLTPDHAIEGVMLVYRTAGGSTFSVYQTDYAGQAGHTIAQWHVDDVDASVRDLQSRGVTFEHYDGIGAYRTTDGGKPVDASGTFTLSGKSLSFKNARELTKALAALDEVRACMTKQVVRYALKRREGTGDEASVAYALDAFARSGYDLREALVAAAKTKSFFYRQPAAGEVLR